MMTLSVLFLGASGHRRRWLKVGGSMIAVGTLVHNFLHRTGSCAGSGPTMPTASALCGF